MRLRLLPVLLAAAAVLSSPAAAHALPAGALVPGGAKADCAGGRGAPCATITRGMANPVTGAFSPDGRSLYVGSLGNGGLFSFARDPRTGRLSPVQGGPACIGYQLGCERLAHPMPEAVVVTHDGRFVYTGGAGPDDGLLAFARDVATGALAPAGCFAGLRTPCAFPGGASTRSDIQALEITPDDRFLVAASVDGIGVVQRDPATGALSQAPGNCVVGDDAATSWDEPSRDCRLDPALGRPLAMDMSADGRFVHVAAEDGGGLHTFALDPATGALRHAGKVKGGFYEVAAAPDGRTVYAVTEDFDLLAFARDPATGALTRIRGPRGCFTVAPGCTYLKGLATPEDVRVTPDGRHVVIAAAEGVTVLARDRATGALRHLRGRGTCATIDGTDGLGMGRARPRECLDGDYALGNLTGFEIAPDGRHGYALETEAGGGYAVGLVQVLRRR